MSIRRSKWFLPAAAVLALLIAGLIYLAVRPSRDIEYGVNLLKNADFESVSGEGLPDHWLPDAYLNIYGVSSYEVVDGRSGKGVLVRNNEANDARYAQTVAVEPGTLYELSGYVRADVQTGRGASVSVMQVMATPGSLLNTQDEWRQVKVYGRTGAKQRELTVYARVGGYSADSLGEASFDDLSLVAVRDVPSDAQVDSWEPWDQSAAAEPAEGAALPFWPWLLVIALLYLLFSLDAARRAEGRQALGSENKRGGIWQQDVLLLLVAALVTRLILAALVPGYAVDIGCFTGWANHMYQVGPAQFYLTEGFSDYPPGYMLALWPLGLLGSLMGGASGFLIKLPAIFCDVAAVALLYSFGARRLHRRAALTLSALYAFSPLVYVTGAAWGQVDSVPALLLLLVVLLAFEHKWSWALPLYVLAVLMKPQALMFGPIGLLALVVDLATRREGIRQALIGIGAALLTALAVLLPFQVNQTGFDWLIKLYSGTMNYYDYATVNAANLYFLFGLNWEPTKSDAPLLLRLIGGLCLLVPTLWLIVGDRLRKPQGREDTALPLAERAGLALSLLPALAVMVLRMPLSMTGVLLMLSAFLLLAVRYAAERDIRNLPLIGAVMLILFCTLGVMMHERYLFTAAALLLLAYMIRRDRMIFWLFCALSLAVFLNVGVVLDRGIRIGGVAGHLDAPNFGIVSDSRWLEYLTAASSLAISGFGLHVALSKSRRVTEIVPLRALSRGHAAPAPASAPADAAPERPAVRRLLKGQPKDRVTGRQWLAVAIVTLLYGALALTNLGSLKAPQNGYTFTKAGEEAVFDLGEVRDFNLLHFGGIHWRETDYLAESSVDRINWTGAPSQMRDGDKGDCFTWKYQKESTQVDGKTVFSGTNYVHHGRWLRISAPVVGLTLYEIVARDVHTRETIPMTLVSGEAAALVDEQDTLDGEPSWFNSMYFDEIYHARTGFEQLNALRGREPSQVYETSHPPLGKLMMTAAIAVFGMVPFGWRFAGAFTGVLMLPGLYLLGRLLTRRHGGGMAAMMLLAFDFMHFTQTRIATIDSFPTLFIIWAYYFMFRYALADDYARPFLKTLPNLALSGLMMGLAVASKFTGIYAGLGLAVIFFWSLGRRSSEGLAAQRLLSEGAALPPAREGVVREAAASWQRRVLFTLVSCLVFFVLIPGLIYLLSFYPVFMQTAGGYTFRKAIDSTLGMYRYHAKPGLGMDHPYYSPWYHWPLIIKPMWFYAGERLGLTGSTIMSFGNPVVWLGGLVGVLLMAAAWTRQHLERDPLRLVRVSRTGDMRPGLLLIAFAAQYLPWALVPRGTYIYHYFPSVPFIILCMVQALDWLCVRHARLARWLSVGLVVLSALFFIAFFPYISGLRVSTDWLDAMRWFPGWIHY